MLINFVSLIQFVCCWSAFSSPGFVHLKSSSRKDICSPLEIDHDDDDDDGGDDDDDDDHDDDDGGDGVQRIIPLT